MLNQNSIAAVQKAGFSKDFCRPLYSSYCFSRIPATIKHLLTGSEGARLPQDVLGNSSRTYDALIFFLIDGFGWRFLEKYSDRFPFLKRFAEQGVASKITSQFPSTTAAHVTCLNSGLNVGESGVYEWFYFEPKLDRVIAPLLFSFAGDHEPGTLQRTGIDPKELYPNVTFYQQLREKGVTPYVIQHYTIAESSYSQVMYNGSEQVPYTDLKDALKQLLRLYRQPRENPAYFYLYFGNIDSMGHRHGIASKEFEEAVEHCFTALEDFFQKASKEKEKNAACIVIADHGMTEVDPKTTLYLNHVAAPVLECMKTNRAGDLIAPAGSCRDFFLHIREERMDEAEEFLKTKFSDVAEIVRTQRLIEQGFFGEAPPSAAFLERVGNLVILPHGNHSIWWQEKHRFDQHFYGAHGGLTRPEMETIFLFQEL